jgi:hypothetical protein
MHKGMYLESFQNILIKMISRRNYLKKKTLKDTGKKKISADEQTVNSERTKRQI